MKSFNHESDSSFSETETLCHESTSISQASTVLMSTHKTPAKKTKLQRLKAWFSIPRNFEQDMEFRMHCNSIQNYTVRRVY